MEKLAFKTDAAFLRRIWNAPENSLQLLCPICSAPVQFAPTWDRARRLAIHPGAYRSANRKHLTVIFELAAPERE
jgi:hypothetical protein